MQITKINTKNGGVLSPTNNQVMETGSRFIVSSERLEEQKIELATLRLQGSQPNHCATVASNKKNEPQKKHPSQY